MLVCGDKLRDRLAVLRGQPTIPLQTGLEKTYAWIYDQYLAREKGAAGVVREFAATSS